MATPTPLTLLAVEDSPDDVELIAIELGRNGLAPEVRRVQTSAEMKRALHEQRWDVICMDYHLPNFDTLDALRVRGELAPDTPVIVVSGHIGETAAVELLKAGADDYIPKHNLARLAPALRRAMRDADQRKARRQAESEQARLVLELAGALALRDEFLGLASHELRTPLTALQLQLESVLRASPDNNAGLREKLARADNQIDRMARLVSDMLVVSKLRPVEAIRLEETDLRQLVVDLVASLSKQQRTNLLSTQLPAEPLVAQVDPVQMQDAVRRLLANAITFGAGRPVELRLERRDALAQVSVVDQGIGIAPEKHDRIFERFGRAESTRHYGGLGLGLWIARAIVEAHGGTLTVESALGQGATFTIAIPLGR